MFRFGPCKIGLAFSGLDLHIKTIGPQFDLPKCQYCQDKTNNIPVSDTTYKYVCVTPIIDEGRRYGRCRVRYCNAYLHVAPRRSIRMSAHVPH